jgi:hypothetical protein
VVEAKVVDNSVVVEVDVLVVEVVVGAPVTVIVLDTEANANGTVAPLSRTMAL